MPTSLPHPQPNFHAAADRRDRRGLAEVAHDQQANDEALVSGERLLSAYRTLRGVKLWVITEADRSSTCCLLPEEY